MRAQRIGLLVAAAAVALAAPPASVATGVPTLQEILDDPLLASPPAGVTRTVSGGQFQTGGGWRTTGSTNRVSYDLGLNAVGLGGEFVGEIRNFNPATQSAATKHHVFTLRASTVESDPEAADGYVWIRAGTNYQPGLKFLSRGPGEPTRETRILSSATWDVNRTYVFRITWSPTSVTLYLDGARIVEHPWSQPPPFRHVYLGRDGYHNYPTMVGPIYERITVSSTGEVPLWHAYEVALTASGSAPNPYLRMPGDNTTDGFVRGTFTGPGGRVVRIDGFWDGGQTWKLRMAPTAVGTWTYTTSSSDPGLNGRSGSFNCVASSRRGHVRVNPAFPHSFMYADGTPFFLVGDTAWGRAWFGDHFSTGRFQRMVDGRASHGFNALTNAIHSYAAPQVTNEGGAICTDDLANSDRINPAFFRWCDRRLAYMNRKDMRPMVMLGAPDGALTTDLTKLVRLQRYLIARWAAYDVFWLFVKEFEEWGSTGTSIVRALGAACDRWDPYRHPTSTHTLDSTRPEVGNDAWLDFNAQQRRTYGAIASDFNNSSKPLVVVEYYYEFVNSADRNPNNPFHRVMNDPVIRQSLWKIQLSGGYNAGYQLVPNAANGLDDTYLANLDSSSARWHRHLRNFFVNRTRFGRLAPRNDLVTAGTAFAAADPGLEYVLYLPSGGSVTVNLSGASGALNVEWCNPRDGTVVAAPSTTGGGSRSFAAPDGNDWVLHLRASSVPFTVTINAVSTGKSYTLGTAQAGALLYIDRSYTIGSLGSALAGGVLVRTANDDKYVTTASHLTLTLSAPATVYVCYDERATALPAWLTGGGFAPTMEAFTNGAAVTRVFARSVPAGSLTLGGNSQAPAAFPAGRSNYVVIVKP